MHVAAAETAALQKKTTAEELEQKVQDLIYIPFSFE